MIIRVEIWQQVLELETDPQLFSPRQADAGTLAMLAQVQLRPADRVLDLGCGYGLVGLAAAKVLGPAQVVLVDVDPLAVRLARLNAARNGCPEVRIVVGDGPAAVAPDHFSLILCNPPYHTDFAVPRRFIEQGDRLLDEGGRLVLVVKRLTWYQKKMSGVFGSVQVQSSGGYYVLTSVKQPQTVRADPPTTRKHQRRQQQTAIRQAARRRTRTRHPDQDEKSGSSKKLPPPYRRSDE